MLRTLGKTAGGLFAALVGGIVPCVAGAEPLTRQRFESWLSTPPVLAEASAVDVPVVLGHVIAHEIGHLLLHRKAPSSGGIMNARVEPLLAAQGVLWFSSTEISRMRPRISTLTQRHAPWRYAAPRSNRMPRIRHGRRGFAAGVREPMR